MTLRLQSKLSILCLFILLSGRAPGQASQRRFTGPSTVSVATLRIPEEAWHHFDKAKIAAAHERMAECERELMKALKIAPAFAQAHLLMATQQVQAHSYPAAVDSVFAAEKSDPSILWATTVLAGAYNGMARYNDAEILLTNLHTQEAESWQAIYERARSETGLNNVEAALHWSEIVLEAAPADCADAHLVRGNALLLAQHWTEAEIQMELYLQSKEPLLHRDQVLAALEETRRHDLAQQHTPLALK